MLAPRNKKPKREAATRRLNPSSRRNRGKCCQRENWAQADRNNTPASIQKVAALEADKPPPGPVDVCLRCPGGRGSAAAGSRAPSGYRPMSWGWLRTTKVTARNGTIRMIGKVKNASRQPRFLIKRALR